MAEILTVEENIRKKQKQKQRAKELLNKDITPIEPERYYTSSQLASALLLIEEMNLCKPFRVFPRQEVKSKAGGGGENEWQRIYTSCYVNSFHKRENVRM